MIKEKKILAIIPARGGSKGIPGKNIKQLNEKPLIAYTIEAALKSRYIDKVIVSSDDVEIIQVSKKYGAEVPFVRPSELSMDTTPGIDPIIHSVNWFKEHQQEFDYVICLQCTSPFRKTEHIDEAIEEIDRCDSDSIVSVCESETSPYWMKLIEDGKMKNFIDNVPFYPRRQDAPIIYRLNGAIYIARPKVLLESRGWYTHSTLAYVMDRESSIDIDDMMDFKFAEFLMKEKKNG